MKKQFLFPLLLLLFVGCSVVPKQQLFQAKTATAVALKNDTIFLKLDNPLKSPLRYNLSSSDSSFHKRLLPFRPVVLAPKTDTLISIAADSILAKTIIINSGLGDPKRKLTRTKFALPFPTGKTYKVIQAYDGNYSHNEPYSKYAIDFSLKEGDTITAANNGVVVGVIQDYKHVGANKKWSNFANYITLYHPQSGAYTQYVHLKQKGSFVKVGDDVKCGQPIGLSGKTGWTDTPHLHFNVMVAVPQGLMSVPVTFYGGIEGSALHPGEEITNDAKN